MYKFRIPNKPIRAGVRFLDTISKDSICDAKLNGWRTLIGKFNGKLHFLTRTNKKQNVTKLFFDVFHDLPEGCELDAEWLNPSRIKAINSEFNLNLPLINVMSVFDIRWWDGKYLANKRLTERRSLSYYKNLPEIGLDDILSTSYPVVKAIASTNVKDFYDLQTHYAISEGVVIKKASGGLKSKWFKVKYK